MRCLIIILLPAIFLSACSSAPPAYIEAKTIPPVTVPAGSDKERLGQLYPVPEHKKTKLTDFEVPLPPTIGVQSDASLARIETLGNQLWVHNAKLPAATWSQLLSFLQARNIATVKRDIRSATIETAWFKQAVQPGFVIRYRLHLERGLQPGSTEIYLTNQKAASSKTRKASRKWPKQAQDSAHGKIFAKALTQVLNDSTLKFSNSYLASTIDLPEKVISSELNGEPVLRVKVREQRLSTAITHALGKDGLLTYEKDGAQGIYHFDEGQNDEETSSFWSFFSLGKDDQSDKKSDYDLATILDNLQDSQEVYRLVPTASRHYDREPLSKVPGYLLGIQQDRSETVILVRDGYGVSLPPSEAKNLLNTIRSRLK